MLSYVLKFADRIIFTIICISALQLPAFIQEYKQRLAGHLTEAKRNLANYERIANKSFNGDIQAMIADYQSSGSDSFQQTGEIIAGNVQRVEELEWVFAHLNHPQLWKNLYYFTLNVDSEIAKGTMSLYQPTVPLSLDAWILAFCTALLCSGLFSGCGFVGKRLGARLKQRLHA